MSSDDLAIHVEGLGKCYNIYDRPQDRLKQSIVPRLRRLVGAEPRSYAREFWALRDVSFDVRKGETVGIIGRNGSGKSTLLQMICGTVTPTTGAIRTNGRVAALLELGAGFNPEFTGRENVYLNAALLGLTSQEIDARFDRIAAFADIGQFIEQPVKQYSSGMFARLAFSVAIHVDPEILIVDEILAVGDAAFQRRCLAKFYEVREKGCTILFVSHDQYQVKSICQRALYLDHGQQKMFGSAGRVIDQYSVDMEVASALILAPVAKEQEEPTIPTDSEAVNTEVVSEPEPAEPERLFAITDVALTNADGHSIDEVASGETIQLRVRFAAKAMRIPEHISFVFNLYRHDGLYLCGSTTLMDGYSPHPSSQQGEFTVTFPNFPLLSGSYKWRVAINDEGGLVVHAEAKDVCPFRVVDDFNSVGLIHLDRRWDVAMVDDVRK
ncbi:ABC transporter ATP-binding protein [Ralstonia pickettii]|uniref:ABC transporter ATP-binding protein n=1 Tax=Ralstonia pickettii TaxID=329 RepID=UPI002715590B|nr:ABC transporter ATP-binding protein [Ralstonia pickettii]WKZ85927.1 ABC transporter ATP-binding protein [Ralstonia pickettii]